MPLRLATAVLLAVAVTSGPAFACKGPTLIFADNFQSADPAWHGELAVSGGHANVAAIPNQFAGAFYGGEFIDSGDYCVNMVGPTLQDQTAIRGGMVFGFTDVENFYAFLAEEDGKATVIRKLNGQPPLSPVAMRAAPALKTGANVTNTLRITWDGTSASAYINDQPFITFNLPQALQNTMIGLDVENDTASGSSPIAYTFSNLKVTNVP